MARGPSKSIQVYKNHMYSFGQNIRAQLVRHYSPKKLHASMDNMYNSQH